MAPMVWASFGPAAPPSPPLFPRIMAVDACSHSLGLFGRDARCSDVARHYAAVRCCTREGECAGSVCHSNSTGGVRPLRLPTKADDGYATYDEAALECEAHGWRLCSARELARCCSSSCGYDERLVWTRSACAPPPPPEPALPPAYADRPSPPSPAPFSALSLHPPPLLSHTMAVDACSSTHGLFGLEAQCSDVARHYAAVRCCTRAGKCAGSVCHSNATGDVRPLRLPLKADDGYATYDEAALECEAHGWRLCSVSEVARCCSSSCGYDDRLVWTRTATLSARACGATVAARSVRGPPPAASSSPVASFCPTTATTAATTHAAPAIPTTAATYATTHAASAASPTTPDATPDATTTTRATTAS
ncbi:hypothetical protein AB1Y20_016883 [Prymnesium parvum]|uniref:SRCR domain-containing protein n=1 Tax=Prymnesium parvum TaxID=97485 RepID=A0AB34IC69_PRYPA